MQVGVAGLALFAVVRSSWVWINRHTSGRDVLNPCGNTKLQYIREASQMTCRTLLLVRLCIAQGVGWIWENPLSSIIYEHPGFQQLLRDGHPVYRIVVRLGHFGAGSSKPVVLYCSDPWPAELRDLQVDVSKVEVYKPGDVVVKYKDKCGISRVRVGARLKSTQSYPPAFGIAMARLYMDNRVELFNNYEISKLRAQPANASDHVPVQDVVTTKFCGKERWADAGLQSVLTYAKGLIVGA